MTILVTGVAGFIGYHVANTLLQQGHAVIGIDNVNDYYDVTLKQARLDQLANHTDFTLHRIDIADKDALFTAYKQEPCQYIIHLAAQAGVRYSLENPEAYVHSNLVGHMNMLELARHFGDTIEHMVYASSSSVYGANTNLPFSVEDRVDQPVSLYAATKKSDEMLSHAYSHLYDIPLTGLRYFTVYGPWGRPDMAAFIFTKAIIEGTPIPVFNHGNMRRNFTYIDDITAGTIACMHHVPDQKIGVAKHRLYNIGNNRSELLMDFIHTLEKHIGKKAEIDFQPIQPGDVPETIADIDASIKDFGFSPKTNIDDGLGFFVDWYKTFYGVEALA